MDEYEEQHPIPQNISSYQFHLVGDMTLKQFAQVGGGALLAILIYSSGMHPLIVWPLAIFSFLFGVALAFFPFQDRPLEVWVLLFFKSIYTPTLFKWKKTDDEAMFFQPEELMVDGMDLPITSVPHEQGLENNEKQILTRIAQLFASLAPKFGGREQADLSQLDGVEPVPVDANAQQQSQIPQPQVISVPPQSAPEIPTIVASMNQPATETVPFAPAYGEAGTITDQLAQFSPDAAPPIPPTRPNIVVGQVVGPKKEIVEGAILEIKDYNSRPIRALKSNKLGHFMIVTPLLDGKYELDAEKPGYEFDPVTFDAKNQIIPPIVVSASSYEEVPVEEDEY